MIYWIKSFWFMRAILYKCFLKSVGMTCFLGKPLFIQGYKYITLENNVRIFPNARMEVINSGEIFIKEGTSIGQNFHIVSSKNKLIIGKSCLISANVFVSNCEHIYGTKQLNENETVIGDNCFLGYGSVILAGTKLGNGCIVGANSTVKGNFPDYSVIVGSPGRVVKFYDENLGVWLSVGK